VRKKEEMEEGKQKTSRKSSMIMAFHIHKSGSKKLLIITALSAAATIYFTH